MPSWQARATNTLSRLLVKRRWKNLSGVDELRESAAKLERWIKPNNIDCHVAAIDCAGIPAQWVWPRENVEAAGMVLYLHGGAFCLHLPAVYRNFVARLAEKTGSRVLLPEYRLAPEHPYPAGVEDCFAVYRWLIEQGTPPETITLAGDSAGGCLVMTTLLQIKQAGLPMPACGVLLSPATDLSEDSISQGENIARDAIFDTAAITLIRNAYLISPEQELEPLASPVLGDLAGLPPLHIQVGDTEMLLDHSLRLAKQARNAGVEVDLKVWGDLPHVHQVIEKLPESREGLELIKAFMGKNINST